MSLVARLVLDPSRRIARLERIVPSIGLAVATATLIARWPDAAVAWVVGAGLLATGLGVAMRRARADRWTLDVADRADVAARTSGRDGAFALGESTLLWPGFALVALHPLDGGRPVARRAVLLDELAPDARRALERFLLWSLRARGGRPADPHARG